MAAWFKKPVCVPCQRFYRIVKNGVTFQEMAPHGHNALPGTAQPDAWHPYKLWVGDLWRCEGCGHETVYGIAQHPLSEHYREDEYAAELLRHPPITNINDC